MKTADHYAASTRRSRIAEDTGRCVTLAILAIGAFAFAVPFYVSVAMSLKSPAELAATSPWAWPKEPSLENYRLVLTNPSVSFALLLKNTAFIAILGALGELVSSSLAAFAFARLRFPGRDRLFLVLLSMMMLPGIVTMIPTYVMFSRVGWVNTFLPLIVPAFFAVNAFNVFLLRQFFMGLPRELDEAAQIDGASFWTIYWRVVMPLSKPALATVGLFSLNAGWRDFMGPLLYLNDPSKQTLEVGLSTYQSLYGAEWHLLMAGSTLVALPLILIFFLGQRYFVKGVVMSGLK